MWNPPKPVDKKSKALQVALDNLKLTSLFQYNNQIFASDGQSFYYVDVARNTLNQIRDASILKVLVAISEGPIQNINFDKCRINNNSVKLYAKPPAFFKRLGHKEQKPLEGFHLNDREILIQREVLREEEDQITFLLGELYPVTHAELTFNFPSGLFAQNSETGAKVDYTIKLKITVEHIQYDYETGGITQFNPVHSITEDILIGPAQSDKDFKIYHNLDLTRSDYYANNKDELTGVFRITIWRDTAYDGLYSRSNCHLDRVVEYMDMLPEANSIYTGTAIFSACIEAQNNLQGQVPQIGVQVDGVVTPSVRSLIEDSIYGISESSAPVNDYLYYDPDYVTTSGRTLREVIDENIFQKYNTKGQIIGEQVTLFVENLSTKQISTVRDVQNNCIHLRSHIFQNANGGERFAIRILRFTTNMIDLLHNFFWNPDYGLGKSYRTKMFDHHNLKKVAEFCDQLVPVNNKYPLIKGTTAAIETDQISYESMYRIATGQGLTYNNATSIMNPVEALKGAVCNITVPTQYINYADYQKYGRVIGEKSEAEVQATDNIYNFVPRTIFSETFQIKDLMIQETLSDIKLRLMIPKTVNLFTETTYTTGSAGTIYFPTSFVPEYDSNVTVQNTLAATTETYLNSVCLAKNESVSGEQKESMPYVYEIKLSGKIDGVDFETIKTLMVGHRHTPLYGTTSVSTNNTTNYRSTFSYNDSIFEGQTVDLDVDVYDFIKTTLGYLTTTDIIPQFTFRVDVRVVPHLFYWDTQYTNEVEEITSLETDLPLTKNKQFFWYIVEQYRTYGLTNYLKTLTQMFYHPSKMFTFLQAFDVTATKDNFFGLYHPYFNSYYGTSIFGLWYSLVTGYTKVRNQGAVILLPYLKYKFDELTVPTKTNILNINTYEKINENGQWVIGDKEDLRSDIMTWQTKFRSNQFNPINQELNKINLPLAVGDVVYNKDTYRRSIVTEILSTDPSLNDTMPVTNKVTGLLAHYRLNDSLLDESGNNYTLTCASPSYSSDAKYDKSISYSDPITTPDIPLSYADFGVTFWIKRNNTTDSGVLFSHGTYRPSTSYYKKIIELVLNGDFLYIIVQDIGGTTQTYTIGGMNSYLPVDTWSYIGLTYDKTDGNRYFYIHLNNQRVERIGQVTRQLSIDLSSNLIFNAYFGHAPYDLNELTPGVLLDDIRIYDKYLTENDVKESVGYQINLGNINQNEPVNMFKLKDEIFQVSGGENFVWFSKDQCEKRYKSCFMVTNTYEPKQYLPELLKTINGRIITENNKYQIILDDLIETEEDEEVIISEADIVAGSVDYQTTAQNSVYNTVEIQFMDEQNYNKKQSVIVRDRKALQSTTRMLPEKKNSAFYLGIVRISEAIRKGNSVLNRQKFIKRTVSFQTFGIGQHLKVGDVIKLRTPISRVGTHGSIINSVTNPAIDDESISEIVTSENMVLTLATPVGDYLANEIIASNTGDLSNSAYDRDTVGETRNFWCFLMSKSQLIAKFKIQTIDGFSVTIKKTPTSANWIEFKHKDYVAVQESDRIIIGEYESIATRLRIINKSESHKNGIYSFTAHPFIPEVYSDLANYGILDNITTTDQTNKRGTSSMPLPIISCYIEKRSEYYVDETPTGITDTYEIDKTVRQKYYDLSFDFSGSGDHLYSHSNVYYKWQSMSDTEIAWTKLDGQFFEKFSLNKIKMPVENDTLNIVIQPVTVYGLQLPFEEAKEESTFSFSLKESNGVVPYPKNFKAVLNTDGEYILNFQWDSMANAAYYIIHAELTTGGSTYGGDFGWGFDYSQNQLITASEGKLETNKLYINNFAYNVDIAGTYNFYLRSVSESGFISGELSDFILYNLLIKTSTTLDVTTDDLRTFDEDDILLYSSPMSNDINVLLMLLKDQANVQGKAFLMIDGQNTGNTHRNGLIIQKQDKLETGTNRYKVRDIDLVKLVPVGGLTAYELPYNYNIKTQFWNQDYSGFSTHLITAAGYGYIEFDTDPFVVADLPDNAEINLILDITPTVVAGVDKYMIITHEAEPFAIDTAYGKRTVKDILIHLSPTIPDYSAVYDPIFAANNLVGITDISGITSQINPDHYEITMIFSVDNNIMPNPSLYAQAQKDTFINYNDGTYNNILTGVQCKKVSGSLPGSIINPVKCKMLLPAKKAVAYNEEGAPIDLIFEEVEPPTNFSYIDESTDAIKEDLRLFSNSYQNWLKLTWTASTSTSVTEYVIRYRLVGSGVDDWIDAIVVGNVQRTEFPFPGTGDYIFEIQARNPIHTSEWVRYIGEGGPEYRTIQGKYLPPDAVDPAHFTVEQYAEDKRIVYIRWNNIGNVDLSHYILKRYKYDVVEYANFASFPVTGEVDVIYLALDTNIIYNWSGTEYEEEVIDPDALWVDAETETLSDFLVSNRYNDSISGIDANGYYVYMVQAVDTSKEVSAITTLENGSKKPIGIAIDIEPVAPVLVSAVHQARNKHIITVTWNEPIDEEDILYYEIFNILDSEETPIATAIVNLYHNLVIDTTNGKEYTLAVRTVNNGLVRSELSNSISVLDTTSELTTVYIEPLNVTEITATAQIFNRTLIKIDWTPDPDEDDIAYYEIRNGSSWETATLIATNVSSNTYTMSLVTNGSYEFLIKPVSRNGAYSLTTMSTGAQTFLKEPEAVENFRAVQNGNKVMVYWDKPTMEDIESLLLTEGYAYENDNRIINVPPSTNIYHFEIDENKLYRYQIIAKSIAGYYSTPVATTIQITNLPPLNIVLDNYLEDTMLGHHGMPKDNLLLSAPLDNLDGSGTTTNETTPTKPIYTTYSAGEIVTGQLGDCIGATDSNYFYSDNDAIMPTEVDEYSITMWVKPLVQKFQAFVALGNTGTARFALVFNNGTAYMSTTDPDVVIANFGSVDAFVERFYKITVIQSNTIGAYWTKLYIDDELIGTIDNTGLYQFWTVAGGGIFFGQSGIGDYQFQGSIQDLKIYSRLLTESEIIQSCGIRKTSSAVGWDDVPGLWTDWAGYTWDMMGASGDVITLNKRADDTYFTSGTFYTPVLDIGADLDDETSIDSHVTIKYYKLVYHSADLSARLQFRTSVDGSDFSPWEDYIPFSRTFRYLQFRIIMYGTTDYAPEVRDFKVMIDVPDKIRAGETTIEATGGTEISFPVRLYNEAYVVVNAVDDAQYTIVTSAPSLTTQKFVVKLYDLTDTEVLGKVQWQLKGY